MLEQFHLTGKRHSGRAVRVEALDDVSVSENLTNAAKQVSGEATIVELRTIEKRLGLQLFIKEISEPTKNPLDPSLKWTKVNAASFEDGLSTFFTAKDVQVLEAIYRDFHEITKDELEMIMGKGMVVASD